MKKYTAVILLMVLIASSGAIAQGNHLNKEKYNKSKDVEDEIGYTHAVKVGNTLYISGTTATGDMDQQVRTIMETIGATLAKYDATFENVVKETIYTTSLDNFIAAKDIRKSFYKNDYPTSTWVEVKRLYLPQFKIEIEVTAVLP